MKRISSIAFGMCLSCLLSLAAPATFRISGTVRCQGKGVAGVAVSDGHTIVHTKADGRYSIRSSLDLGYVFISTPSGYVASCKGPFPQFYRFPSTRTRHPSKVDFELETDTDQSRHTLVCLGDFHLAGINRDLEQFEDLVKDVNEYVAASDGGKLYGVTVGDMSWDQYWVSSGFTIREAVASLGRISGLPIYPVIGNHDYEMEKAGNTGASEAYRRCAGPLYYSFNIGEIHYVVIDAIECTNTGNGQRSYNRVIVDSQLDWLRQDLEPLAEDSQLVVISHIPVSGITNADKLFSLTDRFSKPIHFITAHYHSIQCTNRLNNGSGPRYYDHMVGCPAASLWNTGFHSPGIHICKDGAPGGYFLLDASGTDLSWAYKSTGHPLSYQFRVYDGNSIHLDPDRYIPLACEENRKVFNKIASRWIHPDSDNWIYLNIWGKDSAWKVEAWENGTRLKAETCKLYDPLHIISYPAKILNSGTPADKIQQNTIESRHFVRFKASAPDSEIKIKVTDRFGNIYRYTMIRPMDFSIESYMK